MKTNFIFFGIIAILLIIVLVLGVSYKNKNKKEENLLGINYDVEGNIATLEKYETENPVVAMYIKDYGSIVMELYPDVAPNTVNNFISLVKTGFYDNNTFHRLVPGFVLQGGDPDGTGAGGPGYKIKGEFSDNGFENNLKHEKGILSMARGSDNDSGGSQFFIVLDANDYLDGKYAAFGKIIDGYDIIDKIVENEKVADSDSGKLAKNLVIKKAIIDLKGKEYPEVEKVQ